MLFEKENHTYTLNGIEYYSVTTVLDNFSETFESDRISSAIARRDKRNQEEILEEWDLKREISCDWGNALHKSAELWIKYNQKPNVLLLQRFIDELSNVLDREKSETETIVWDKELMVAGTIDILHHKSKKKSIMYDIKTNNDLDKSHGKMLEPFDKIKDSKINKYRMQLTTYKHLYEKQFKKKVEDMFILQVQVNEDNKIEIKKIEIEPIEGIIEAIKELNLETKKVGNIIDNLI